MFHQMDSFQHSELREEIRLHSLHITKELVAQVGVVEMEWNGLVNQEEKPLEQVGSEIFLTKICWFTQLKTKSDAGQ